MSLLPVNLERAFLDDDRDYIWKYLQEIQRALNSISPLDSYIRISKTVGCIKTNPFDRLYRLKEAIEDRIKVILKA